MKINFKKFNQKIFFFLYHYLLPFLIIISCAFFSSLAYKIFLNPNVKNAIIILPSGIMGIATIFTSYLKKIFINIDYHLMFSIINILLNLPLFFIAYKYMDSRFWILTLIYVVFSNIFLNINFNFIKNLAENIACVIKDNNIYYQIGLLQRTVLSACCYGAINSLIFDIGASSGGLNIISICLSFKKKANTANYLLISNLIVIVLFTIFSFFEQKNILNTCLSSIFAIIHSCFATFIFSIIESRNKKEQIQIITKNENLYQILLKNTKHSATIINSKGAFTGEKNFTIYITVSIYETKKIINLIKENDANSFINIIDIKQVYGNFSLN